MKVTFPILLLLTISICSAKNAAEIALDDARRLAAQGKFEEALEKQVWFHNHALEVDPAYYGVRLSFALSDWIELGKQYPKALDTLKSIRDEKTSRLLAGEASKELFHDVEAINDHLGESKATVDLFRKIEVSQPEFAASVYGIADEALIDAGEYALARKYLGDPFTRFANAKRVFEEGMNYARTSPSGDASRKAFESIFTDDVVRRLASESQNQRCTRKLIGPMAKRKKYSGRKKHKLLPSQELCRTTAIR